MPLARSERVCRNGVMALREEFEQAGNWLFKWRSYLPLLMLGLVLVALRDFDYPGHSHSLDRAWGIFCLMISFLGLAVRIITAGSAPKGTSGRNTKGQNADSLNTTGMYSIVRHPLYLGNFLIWLGIALSLRSVWFAVITILIFWLYYERIMFAEEEYLRRKFSQEYLHWAERTPAFLPKFSQWKSPDYSLSIKAGLGNEYHGLLGITSVFAAFEMIEECIVQRRIVFEPGWIFLITFGVVAYVILLFLKKKTTILNKT